MQKGMKYEVKAVVCYLWRSSFGINVELIMLHGKVAITFDIFGIKNRQILNSA